MRTMAHGMKKGLSGEGIGHERFQNSSSVGALDCIEIKQKASVVPRRRRAATGTSNSKLTM